MENSFTKIRILFVSTLAAIAYKCSISKYNHAEEASSKSYIEQTKDKANIFDIKTYLRPSIREVNNENYDYLSSKTISNDLDKVKVNENEIAKTNDMQHELTVVAQEYFDNSNSTDLISNEETIENGLTKEAEKDKAEKIAEIKRLQGKLIKVNNFMNFYSTIEDATEILLTLQELQKIVVNKNLKSLINYHINVILEDIKPEYDVQNNMVMQSEEKIKCNGNSDMKNLRKAAKSVKREIYDLKDQDKLLVPY